MSAPGWPPPAGPDDWRTVWLDGESVAVRPVALWGREVLIDATDKVLCDGCWQLIDAEQLGQASNVHPVGLPRRDLGQLRDLPDDDDPRHVAAVVPPEWQQ